LGDSYNNIGLVYENMDDYLKAYSFYERAVENGQHSLPTNHPTLQERKKNLKRVKNKL
jgi:tetratricopeptide (TPR) repeat protein